MPESRRAGPYRIEFVVEQATMIPVACQTRHTWEDPSADSTTCRVCGALRAVELWDPWANDEEEEPSSESDTRV